MEPNSKPQLKLTSTVILTTQELICALSDYGLTEREIDKLVLKLDTDGDGAVSEAEFVAGYQYYCDAISRRKIGGKGKKLLGFGGAAK